MPAAAKRHVASGTDGKLRRVVEAVCTALIEAEPRLTELDRQVGDGDLGISMERVAKAIKQAAQKPKTAKREG